MSSLTPEQEEQVQQIIAAKRAEIEDQILNRTNADRAAQAAAANGAPSNTRTWRIHPEHGEKIFETAREAILAEKDGWVDSKSKIPGTQEYFKVHGNYGVTTATAPAVKTFDVETIYAASDAALKLAAEHGIDIKSIVPANGKNITKPDVEAAIAAKSTAGAAA